jgi:hypothetical protein
VHPALPQLVDRFAHESIAEAVLGTAELNYGCASEMSGRIPLPVRHFWLGSQIMFQLRFELLVVLQFTANLKNLLAA